MLRALAELVGLVRPSGNDLVFGLEHDMRKVATLEQGWHRLCETAWALGFVSLRLTPDAACQAVVPRWHATVPGGGAAATTWAFEVIVEGKRLATVTARRGANGLEFDPNRLVEAVQVLLARFQEPLAGA